ncbi:MAG TPA: hypothetical protein VEA99_19815, partial [Gemmatimonadaceae bacterium]|nr:hypothetical protein [Gemmatimonadaceae bacterium]
LLGGGVTIALVGWLDDRRGLSSLLRLLVHLVAAAWAAWWIGVPRWLPWSGSAAADSGALAEGLLAALAIAWCTNLYNFMDGIDGIAAAEGVLVAATGALLTAAAGATGAAIVAGLIAAGCAGFLVWNWAPARIFMGDVSSGLLGFLFGAVALLSERSGGPGVLVWALLFGTFVFDATVTLVRRAAHGERWYAAHRSHAYQRLVQSGWGHARVVLAYVAVGLVLAALAALHLRGRLSLAAAYGAALALLAVAYLLVERRRPMGRSGDPAPASGGQPIDPPASSEPW